MRHSLYCFCNRIFYKFWKFYVIIIYQKVGQHYSDKVRITSILIHDAMTVTQDMYA